MKLIFEKGKPFRGCRILPPGDVPESPLPAEIFDEALNNPEKLHAAPVKTVIRRPDEVKAARQPALRYID